LEPVSARLGQEKVRDQFAPGPVGEDIDAEWSFAGRVREVASERRLSVLLGLSGRERTVSALAVLTTPATKEAR
jgi:hypothetical protein